MIDYTKLRKIDFEKLLHFYKIFREGSITKAAESTGKPRYTFYYDLKTLEEVLGTKLYIGGKKNFILTKEGQRLAEFCKQTLDNLNMVINNKEDFVQGDLVIHTTITLGLHYFPSIIKAFTDKYPQIKIKLLSGPEYIGSRFHDFDVLVAHGLDNRTDLSQNIVKEFHYGYFASKEYIEKHGQPISEGDLKNHKFLCFTGQYLVPENIMRNAKIIIESNSYLSLSEMCLNGLGICSLSLDVYKILLKENYEKYSKLIRILPEILSETDTVHFSFFKFTAKEKPIRELFEITKEIIRKEAL